MKERKYCCFCREELKLKTLRDETREKHCSKCDHVFFEAPSPTVIVAVTNADTILLTRSVEWTHHFWGLVAGHLKSEETAEEAAVREVHEETGLTVTGLTILRTFIRKAVGTDSDLLMIAFVAETKDTRIKKGIELEKAAWFKLSEPLPLRPGAISCEIVSQIFPKCQLVESLK
jgi:NAD+ diphosphatase